MEIRTDATDTALEYRPRVVRFFFGAGSRYSYLAATQIPDLVDKTGAAFIWRAVYSPDLIERAGANPFDPDAIRGQYHAAYRTRDAQRWADYYGVCYVEPRWEGVDWRSLALACVAADLIDAGEIFAKRLLETCFAYGNPPRTEDELAATAASAGITYDRLAAAIGSQAAFERHERNIRDALAAGAFGVPTFVTDDGELFWGQDRIPLLRRHLGRAPCR